MIINENEVFKPILEIIDFNYPTQREKDKVYREKTIFFERVFFRTLSHICQECLVNSDNPSFSKGLPNKIYITKYIPNLVVKQADWEKINKETGFDIIENRSAWAKLVLEFTRHRLDLANKISLPEGIQFSTIQTILLIQFCYFYYFGREYAALSSERNEYVLPEKKDITWALFEPGVISEFISPLRKLTIFNQFDERELAQFFKLSGNPLKSLRWILKPVYREWFQPLRRSLMKLNTDKILSDARFSLAVLAEDQGNNMMEKMSPSPIQNPTYLSLPQVDTENHKEDEEKDILAEQEQKNWEQLYYEKILEVQRLRQQLMEKTEGISNNEILELFEELLRFPGEFDVLFSKVLPYRKGGLSKKWRTLERTMLNLRSLFVKSEFVTFGRINEIVFMKTVAWPYAIDDRASITNPDIAYNKWKITRRGVRKNEIIILPALVQPS
ncbi:hypothetical protein QUF58_12950 [Anaerolineales bacterium HSG24]|nr:hypothetical protein [Anaerolineales bacterium HSG24]